jgi:hypothetical protein
MSLGIVDKSDITKRILEIFSKSDFKHDFSISNSSIIKALRESVPLGTGKVNYLRKVNEFNSTIGTKSIYEFLKDEYSKILPVSVNSHAKTEDQILKDILNISYTTWRNELLNFNLEDKLMPPEKRDIIIDLGTIKRNYKVKFHPTKDKKMYYNLPNTFKQISNGKNKFVLIIDASFFPMSSIGVEEYLINQYIGTYDPNESYEFYILENSENSSDSAKKISKFSVQNENIKVFILREKVNSIITYPNFNTNSQESNLFTNIEISSKKVKNNQVNAILNIDNVLYEREDLGSISQIERSSFLAFQNYILNNDITKETMSYFLLKRAGDWCQALSLLDYTREYEVYDNNNVKLDKIETLNNLQKDSVIGLVTHDRILLAYSLLLGLNVFYSLKVVSAVKDDNDSNSITWCMYFQNTLSEIYYDDIEDIKNAEEKCNKFIDDSISVANTSKNTILSKISKANIDFNKLDKFTENIIYLRYVMIQLTSIYFEESFKSKKDEIVTYYNKIRDITKVSISTMSSEEKKEVSNNLSNIRSLVRSINEMNTHNIGISKLEKYETQDSEKYYINDLKHVNIKNITDEKSNYIFFVVNEFKKDYLELKEYNINLPVKSLFEELNYGRDPKYRMMISEFINIVEERQSGGSLLDLLHTIPKPEMIEEPKYFNDKYGNFYSNYNGYIVTSTHLDILENGLKHLGDKPLDDYSSEEDTFYKRFILYYLDELYTKLFTLEGRIQYENKIAQFEYDLYLEYVHVLTELDNIYSIYKEKKTALDLYNLYFINRNKWTSFYLEGENPSIMRYLRKDKIKFGEIAERLYNKHQTVKDYIFKKRRRNTTSSIAHKRLKINNGGRRYTKKLKLN